MGSGAQFTGFRPSLNGRTTDHLILRAPNCRLGRRMLAYSGGILPHVYTPPRAALVWRQRRTQVQRARMHAWCARTFVMHWGL